VGPSAAAATKDMDMGAASGAFKETADEDFGVFQDYSADRAYPFPISPETVNTAPDMHEPVFAAVHGWESQGAHQFTVLQFC